MNNRIVRTICYFKNSPSENTSAVLNEISQKLSKHEFEIQTKRVCSPMIDKVIELENKLTSESFLLSAGTIGLYVAEERIGELLSTKDVSFNLDLTAETINEIHSNLLFEIIKINPKKTFNFTYVFNNKPQTPFFPSASYSQDGFSIGLQPTNLSEGCKTLSEWLEKVRESWQEIYDLFKNDEDFLGIDSSIAPLFTGKSSLLSFIKRLGYDFSRSVTTDIYLQITKYISENNPKPVGLCGLMLPCLEDFDLANEYEKGNFSIERNTYLSLHCGLGIDTYPMGVDESLERVTEILSLIQNLSNKYNKPLSVRFVSDGKSQIGDRTDFKNQYLKDVVIRKL